MYTCVMPSMTKGRVFPLVASPWITMRLRKSIRNNQSQSDSHCLKPAFPFFFHCLLTNPGPYGVFVMFPIVKSEKMQWGLICIVNLELSPPLLTCDAWLLPPSRFGHTPTMVCSSIHRSGNGQCLIIKAVPETWRSLILRLGEYDISGELSGLVLQGHTRSTEQDRLVSG